MLHFIDHWESYWPQKSVNIFENGVLKIKNRIIFQQDIIKDSAVTNLVEVFSFLILHHCVFYEIKRVINEKQT